MITALLQTINFRINLNYMYAFSTHRAVNTLRLRYKKDHLLRYMKIIALCSEIRIKPKRIVKAESIISER